MVPTASDQLVADRSKTMPAKTLEISAATASPTLTHWQKWDELLALATKQIRATNWHIVLVSNTKKPQQKLPEITTGMYDTTMASLVAQSQ